MVKKKYIKTDFIKWNMLASGHNEKTLAKITELNEQTVINFFESKILFFKETTLKKIVCALKLDIYDCVDFDKIK